MNAQMNVLEFFHFFSSHPRYAECGTALATVANSTSQKITKDTKLQELDVTQHVFKCAEHNGWCEPFSRDPTWAQDVRM